MSKMKIRFFPQRRDDRLELERQGDVLFVNGKAHDFSDIPDGGMQDVQGSDHLWMVEPVRRRDGDIELALFLPIGAFASQKERFPAPVIVIEDGPVTLPGSGTS